ncbi:uncharacterized protein METZ01_LOCUS53641 [marine metagenome]|uniref:Uncharacterized protein n=1 Tax=marine metagenome TaxID=408172 RepID=A0A381SEQ1_9ZZZZ|tara:strand:+ start:446 stop:1297 length:852 start_codon:yes stop_codon:yes gene_type:complete
MAFKNIFSSTYAIVENVNYNGPRKALSFDLVLYRDSHKEVETGRMQYHIDGGLTTFEIDSVITTVPAGLEHEAMPADFDFDVFDTFKPYLIGNNPTHDEFTLAGCGELKTGFQYICEIPPQKDDDGEWPSSPTEEHEQIDNPDYDEDNGNEFLAAGEVVEVGTAEKPEEIVGAADGSTWNPFYTPLKIDGDQIYEWHKIKYGWGALHRPTDYAFLDKDGDYWIVSGNMGSGSVDVQQVDKPFLDTDWDTWFSATAMDKVGKNISERIYTWLKAKPEYKDAVDI